MVDQGSSISLVSGSLTLNTPSESIGWDGSGAFIQSGGYHSTGLLYIGNNPGSSGHYVLSGGTLEVNYPGSTWVSALVGWQGNGSFGQSGGTNIILYFEIGRSVGATGRYDLTNGQLNVLGYELVGHGGAGFFNQFGGSHIANQFYVGGGDFGNGTGNFNLSGGSLSVAENEVVGNTGSGTFK